MKVYATVYAVVLSLVSLFVMTSVNGEPSAPASNAKSPSVSSVKYYPRARYAEKNPWQNLRIIGISATYEPFAHDPKDEKACGPSCLTFTFSIRNQGRKPIGLPWTISYIANHPRPWMEPDHILTDEELRQEHMDAVVGGTIYLPKWTLKPNETLKLTDRQVPARGGPWNPLKMEARFCSRDILDTYFVGDKEPYRTSVTVDAPDYFHEGGTFRVMDGKPRDQALRWQGVVKIGLKGPAVDGHVHYSSTWHRLGGKGVAMRCGEELQYATGGAFVTRELNATSPPDWTDIPVKLYVTCTKHPLTGYLLIDANPSNDEEIRHGFD